MAIYLGTNKVDYVGTNGGYMLNGHLILTKTYSFNLGQTNYSSLTPSTTAQTLTLFTTDYTTTAGTTIKCYRIGENYDGTIINRDAYDYVIFFECVINYNYGSNNVSSTIHGIRSTYVKDFQEGKYRNTVIAATGEQNITYTKSASNITIVTPFLYQKADNTYAVTTSQGIYHSGTTIASFNTADSKDYIELQCGAFSLKAHDTYCPASSLALINPSQTTVQATWYIYEGDRSMFTNIYDRAYELVFN